MVRLDSVCNMAKTICFPVARSTGGGELRRREKVIRLALHGCANRPFYHIVLTNRWRPRDCPPYELLGTYDPMPNKDNQKLLSLNLERVRYWMGRNAKFSSPMNDLLGRIGFLPLDPYAIRQAWGIRKRQDKAAAEEAAKPKSTEVEKS